MNGRGLPGGCMKKIIIIGCVIFPGFIFSAPIAKFSLVVGKVESRTKNGKWVAAKPGTPLEANSEVQTSLKGKAQIEFVNGNKIFVNPGTVMGLEKYVTGSYGTATDMTLKMGKVTTTILKTGREDQRNHFRVRTPTVVAGVRGTIQDIGHTAETGTEITLLESSSEVVDASGFKSIVPQKGTSQVNDGGTITADKVESRFSSVSMGSEVMSSDSEMELMFESGDFTFSGNPQDLFQLYDDMFDIFNDLYGGEVTFEKL